MGDEQLLLPDLINAASWAVAPPGSRGPAQPANNNWESKNDFQKIAAGGSGNIPKMREAIRYLRDPDKYNSETVWLGILTQERDDLGFMALETYSSIYGNWHLYAQLVVLREATFRGRQDLVQLSKEWLQLYFLGNAFAYVRGRRVTCPGMRSVGHMANAGLREYSIELALTEPGQPVAIPGPPSDIAPFLLKGDERKLLDLYRPEIAATAAAVRAAFPDPDRLAACYVPGWTIHAPFHFLRAPDGIAAWAEKNYNGNTAPVLAGVQFTNDPQPLWLPPGGGVRYRQWDDAHCQRQGDLLDYTSPRFGHNQQAIPGHGMAEYVWQGKSFAKADGTVVTPSLPPDSGPTPTTPDQPDVNSQTPLAPQTPLTPVTPQTPLTPSVPVKPAPVTPAKPSAPPAPMTLQERQAIAGGIAKLKLAKTQLAMQDRIVQELRKDPLDRSPAAIADEVATFGIGPGQKQAADWKSLIARLRALSPA